MNIKSQLEIIEKMGLGKKKKVVRSKWTAENELDVFTYYCDQSTSTISGLVSKTGKSESSIKMKLGNIEAIISGQSRGLSHISKLTIDIINENKHLLKKRGV